MGRNRIPEGDVKINVALRLKRRLVEKIKNDGKPQQIIEKIMEDEYKKETKE